MILRKRRRINHNPNTFYFYIKLEITNGPQLNQTHMIIILYYSSIAINEQSVFEQHRRNSRHSECGSPLSMLLLTRRVTERAVAQTEALEFVQTARVAAAGTLPAVAHYSRARRHAQHRLLLRPTRCTSTDTPYVLYRGPHFHNEQQH